MRGRSVNCEKGLRDKPRRGHKAGVTRKGNAKSKSEAGTSPGTNLFNRPASAAAVKVGINEPSD